MVLMEFVYKYQIGYNYANPVDYMACDPKPEIFAALLLWTIKWVRLSKIIEADKVYHHGMEESISNPLGHLQLAEALAK